ncbi:putative capsid and scaffold protein [Escherichia phage vB_Eco_SLUR63]|nr:putative capsid and scaffold protein [Escherichia phage vB_Eco_SLUR25]VAY27794.1 putative capsid and scaffold protein [Escherichia phage vB_Eco_SLUR63]
MLFSPFSDTLLNAMEQSNVSLVLAAEIDFPSGVTRVHTGTGVVVINGQTFLGVGTLGDVGSVTEENSTSSSTMSMALSGLDMSLVGETLNEEVIGRNVVCYIAVMNEQGNVIAANVLFEGFITDTALQAGQQNALSYVISNVFERWSQGLPDRYTDESQQRLYPGDRFFRYIAQMAERSIFWGSKKDAPGFSYE